MIWVLLRQTAIQDKMLRMQERMNNYQKDLAYTQQVERDVEFTIAELKDLLEKTYMDRRTLRDVLVEDYVKLKGDIQSTDEQKVHANNLNDKHPNVYSLWSAFYPVLGSLSKATEADFLYMNTYSSIYSKILSIFSVPLCIALDNYMFILKDRSEKEHYFFRNGPKPPACIAKALSR